MPLAFFALTIAAYAIGTTEFVIMGLLPEVAADLSVTIPEAGWLVTGYALAVAVGAPVMAVSTARLKRRTALIMLMAFFIAGNLLCAVASDYWVLMIARIVTALCHGAFFGIGSVVAAGLVSEDRRARAVALMFTLVCIGWVFFRADSIGDAWHVLTHALVFGGASAVVGEETVSVPILWALIGGLVLAEWVYRHFDRLRPLLEGGRLPAIAGRYALIAAIVVSVGASQLEARPFIYFQF